MKSLRALVGLIGVAFVLLATFACHAQPATGQRGIAATVQPIATEAAVAAMKEGGNAIDGAVAAALTLGVVDGHNSGIGGGCFLVIRLADGTVATIDGRETAPAKAERDMFLRNGKADTRLSQTGALASGVPGALAAYDLALRRYGRFPLAKHSKNAAAIAERGFKLDRTYAGRLAATAEELRQFDSARTVFLRADGSVYRQGEVLKQPELAATYRAIAENGIDWFYRGPFASKTEQWMKKNGGVLMAADFASYQAKVREPITNTYRGYTIIGFPPPSSGGVHVAQILNILENFDLRKMGAPGHIDQPRVGAVSAVSTGSFPLTPPSPQGRGRTVGQVVSADVVHVVGEAMKLAFADRAFWLGDPDFVPVPRGLVSKEYAAKLAKRIQMDRVTAVESHDTPEGSTQDLFGKHTTHFCTADATGNWVACTATINTSFGSKVVIPGTGVVLNNQMDDFAIQPGVANYFGLIGAEANAVEPRKRPLSSMSPTIVLKDGKPVMSVGAAGGPTIISQVVLAIVYFIDFGMPVEEALAAPRFHHQWRPDELKVEKRIGAAAIKELERRGHHISVVEALGAAQGISFSATEKHFTGAADPRGGGNGEGW